VDIWSLASRRLFSLFALCVAGGVALAIAAGASTAAPPDPLDVAVRPSAFAKKGTTTGIARRGNRLVAVGPRGLILLSVDAAKTWTQIDSPVATDLVTVKFTDDRTVWAVGHDAVALRSLDGGATWERLLDGRMLLKLMRSTYTERAKSGTADAAAVLKEVEGAIGQSATADVLPTPFLDVWFADAKEGWLVGAFGLVLHTIDGGQSWLPMVEQTDNERRFHLYAVTGLGEQRYIAGEQGLVLRWDAAAKRFAKVVTPYAGSYFGIDVAAGRLVAYGLRGNAYVSEDNGVQWRKLDTGVDVNLVALVPVPKGGFVLVSQAGHLLAVAAGATKVVPLQAPFTAEVFSAAPGSDQSLVLAQVNGLRNVDLLGLPGQ
jgi:photosystem II stability/assembly factor-like uncharacterized protein